MVRGIWLGTVVAATLVASAIGCGGSSDRITLVGRQNNSGTYEYFREEVLGKEGQFRQGISAQSGSKDVVELVSKTPTAIGYSGMGYATDEVKMLRISKKKGESGVEPTIENAKVRKYPLSRPLYIYTAGEPTGAAKHYIDWIRSVEGQKIMQDEGYVPNSDPSPVPTDDPPEGKIAIEGSDTMVQVAGKWAEVYMKKYPQVKIVVQGGGSGKGIASLINATTDLATASREMKPEEKKLVQEKSGKEVTENVVGLDAVAIYVHKTNPLDVISIEELADIYGKQGKTVKWSILTGAGAKSQAASY